MPFVKGDPNINRGGRPKNAEPELLRAALAREGVKRGEDFWDKVASFAFTDKNVMVAIIKKFVPDMTQVAVEGELKGGNTQVVIVREVIGNQSQAGELPRQVSVIRE